MNILEGIVLLNNSQFDKFEVTSTTENAHEHPSRYNLIYICLTSVFKLYLIHFWVSSIVFLVSLFELNIVPFKYDIVRTERVQYRIPEIPHFFS